MWSVMGGDIVEGTSIRNPRLRIDVRKEGFTWEEGAPKGLRGVVEGVNEGFSSSGKKLAFLATKEPTIFNLDGRHEREVMGEGETESLVHGLTLCIKPMILGTRSRTTGRTRMSGPMGESVEGCLPKDTG